jgi:hypothetical protein
LAGDINKITHSYTAQFPVTLNRYLQDTSAAVGPVICEKIETLSEKCWNVSVTATKSGKLQKEIYKRFFDNIIKLHVKKDKLMRIIDSWGGKTNHSLYVANFVNENHELTCSLKITAAKCTQMSAA